jgi:hypothetical protein
MRGVPIFGITLNYSMKTDYGADVFSCLCQNLVSSTRIESRWNTSGEPCQNQSDRLPGTFGKVLGASARALVGSSHARRLVTGSGQPGRCQNRPAVVGDDLCNLHGESFYRKNRRATAPLADWELEEMGLVPELGCGVLKLHLACLSSEMTLQISQ